MFKKRTTVFDRQIDRHRANASCKRTLAFVLSFLLLLSHLAALPITEAFWPVPSAMAEGLVSNAALKASAGGMNPFANADEARRGKLAAMAAPAGKPGPGKSVEPPGGVDDPDLGKTGKNRYLVKFRADISAEAIAAALVGESYKLVGFSKNRLVRLATDDLAAFQKKAAGLLAYAEAEVIRKAHGMVNDPLASEQWGLGKVNLEPAWNVTTGSNSVLIAVIDSGIDRSHPDLDQADIRYGIDYLFGGPVNGDGAGHGTSVTSVIAAETNNSAGMAGVNWNAAVIPLRVLDAEGRGTSTDVIQAIYDAADIGCKVINMSLGSAEYSAAEYDAVQYANSKGCIVIASAGNDGSSTLKYPASLPGVISVTSIDRLNNRSPFSDFNSFVDLCAPGEDIVVASPYSLYGYHYIYRDGTSFSAPFVSGIAALAASVKPGLTGDQFLDLAGQSSVDLGTAGRDDLFGYGLIDAGRLMSRIVNPDDCIVRFYSAGGTLIDPIHVKSGSKIAAPPEPVQASYDFRGWFKDFICSDDWDFSTDVVTRDMTLFAKWIAKYYVITYLDWDGKVLKTEIVGHGGTLTPPYPAPRPGYTFIGWDKSTFTFVQSDLTFTAQYRPNVYTVTFNSTGGSAIAPVSANHGTKIAAPAPAPTRTGYVFGGWYKDAALTDDWDFATDTVTGNLTLHAKWNATETMVRAFVTRFYQLFFNREPDQGGLDHWTNGLMSRTMTGAYVAAFFVDSDEFRTLNVSDTTFLDMMYRAFFDREPDTGGKAHWQAYLDNGMSRYWVLCNFVNSDEFQGICTEYGIVRGALALTQPADLYPKITAFVARFYKLTLERMPDEEGLNYWVKDLADGKRTGAVLAKDFVFSQEFVERNTTDEQFVTIMYRAFFGREPEVGGRDFWTGELASGRMTRFRVLVGFVDSAEFAGICGEYGIVRGTLG